MFANFEKRAFESEKIGLHGVCLYFDVRGLHIVNVRWILSQLWQVNTKCSVGFFNLFEAEIKAQYLIINVQTFKFKYVWYFGAYLFGMGGFLQVLSQCCISRGSETYKTGDMGLTKTLREFLLLLHQSPCAKKPCRNNSTCLSGFTDKSDRCLCSAGFKGRTCDEGKIRLNVISFMEKMSVFPSVT